VIVTIEPCIGMSIGPHKREIRHPQHIIRVDGMEAGIVGFAEGSKIMLTHLYAPHEVTEIEKQIEKLTSQSGHRAVLAPKIPDKRKEDEEIDADDFDT